jgi:hypothetical protein
VHNCYHAHYKSLTAMKTLFLIIILSIGKTVYLFAQQDSLKMPLIDSTHQKPIAYSMTQDTVKEAITHSDWHGEFTIATGFYRSYGLDEARGQILPYSLNGKLTLVTNNGWTLPITMICNSQHNRFIQPYNQIGATPTYKKWLILHGGYRNVHFSPLTLAGHTFLGGGIELNPGKFRFGAIYGKFNRAIESNYITPDIIPVFERTGFSVKLGVGSQISSR